MTNHLDEKVDQLQQELGEIEMGVLTQGYTLADAIREGCGVTDQAVGWHDTTWNNACALSAAYLAAKARGVIK